MAEANLWGGEAPKEIKVNPHIEVESLLEEESLETKLATARSAVVRDGIPMALARVPKNIFSCDYVPAGGVYQMVEDGSVVGYALKTPFEN